jgi:hypothetical protein
MAPVVSARTGRVKMTFWVGLSHRRAERNGAPETAVLPQTGFFTALVNMQAASIRRRSQGGAQPALRGLLRRRPRPKSKGCLGHGGEGLCLRRRFPENHLRLTVGEWGSHRAISAVPEGPHSDPNEMYA